MGDNHPVLNRRWRVEQALQRLVQGRLIDQLARPYYVSIPSPLSTHDDFLVPVGTRFPARYPEKMVWDDWLGLPPEKFIKRLRRRLTKPLSNNQFIALYNALMGACDNRLDWVLILAPTIAELLEKQERPRDAALFLELTARAQVLNEKVLQAFKTLQNLARLDDSSDTRKSVLELVRGIVDHADDYAASLDHRPAIYRQASALFDHYQCHQDIAELHIKAAYLYARHGAFQAAYRSVADVEKLAIEQNSLPMLAKAFEAGLGISCDEGDQDFAIGAAGKALKALRELNEKPGAALLSNFGTALMRTGAHSQAATQFRKALKVAPADMSIRSAIEINLAACLRHLGRAEEAAQLIGQARANLGATDQPEPSLELELIAARLNIDAEDFPALGVNLRNAARHFDAVLTDVLRLHHRRGLRERYLPRFDSLLSGMPNAGAAEDVLSSLVACRGNALGDWLALTEWVERARNRIDSTQARDLDRTLERMRGEGVPHLFGLLEKYDDAWEPGNLIGGLWDELSRSITNLETDTDRALSGASLDAVLSVCHDRLSEGHCIMATTYGSDSPLLWALFGQQYWRIALPMNAVVSWEAARLRFEAGQLGRTEFAAAIDDYLDIVSPLIKPVFDEIGEARCRSLRYLNDFTGAPPITALVLRHSALRARMAKGQFEPRLVEALRPGDESRRIEGPVVAIVDKNDGLLLTQHEATALADSAGLPSPAVVDATDARELPDIIGDADTLIVSTHGVAIGRYTDPTFASLGGGSPHPIEISAPQQHAYRLRLRLALLNSCYSGSVSARNYQREFRSSDAVSFPAFLLLNGRSIACAGQWRTSDTVSYLFSCGVGRALQNGLSPAAAIASSIASTAALTRGEAIAILDTITAPDDREGAIRRLEAAPENGPFSHPYLSGAFTIHSLL